MLLQRHISAYGYGPAFYHPVRARWVLGAVQRRNRATTSASAERRSKSDAAGYRRQPKKLKIVELDAAQLPRSLADLDAAAINGNYAESAGLNPIKDAIAIENAKGPYANLIAVREADKGKPWVAKLVKAYHSPEVKQYVVSEFKNSVITAW